MVLLFTISSLTFAGEFECPSFHQEIRLAKDSLWIGDVPAMESALDAAHVGLKCSITLNADTVRDDLGDFFLLKAYSSHLSGQVEERTWWLQQSYNLGHWNVNFGPEIEAFRRELTESKLIDVSILPAVNMQLTYVVDGTPTDDLILSEGMHWVEIHHQSELMTAQLLNVAEGAFVQLPDTVLLSEPSEHQRGAPWLARTVFFASVAISTHIVAMLSHQEYEESTSLSQLETQRVRTWRWGQTSLVSGALALGYLARWIAMKKPYRDSISIDNTSSALE